MTRVVMDKMKVNPSGSFKFDICRSLVGCLAIGNIANIMESFHATGTTNFKISVGGCHTKLRSIMGPKWKEVRNQFESLRQ
jgi:hypothetical protein